MKLQISLARRLRLGIVLSAAAAGALFVPLSAGAMQERNLESFSAQSRAATVLDVHGSGEASAWILHSDEQGSGARELHIDPTPLIADSSGADSRRYESFAKYDNKHHEHDGGGWVEHGGLGDGDRDCDDGCVGTSAVPEPSRAALTFVGILALVILVKRQRRGGHGLFAPR